MSAPTYSATILIGRVAEAELLHREPCNGNTVYDSRSLRFLPGVESVPLLVDHDPDRQIGRVTGLQGVRWGDERWIAACATIDHRPPWLAGGTGASFGSRTLESQLFRGWTWIHQALVDEVTVTSSAQRPLDPGARVLWLNRQQARTPPSVRSAGREMPTHGQTILPPVGGIPGIPRDPELAELSRRIHAAGPNADVEVILRNLRRELHGPTADDLCAELAVSGRRGASSAGGGILGVR